MRARLIAPAAAVALAGLLSTAPAASASTLPSTNTSHHCMHHTTGLCGWTHHQKPRDKYETAKCKDASPSYSKHAQGTCSHHHGVRYWFK
ncbi:DUF3761 domain-containing protein [Streptomyces sp. NPDC001500]